MIFVRIRPPGEAIWIFRKNTVKNEFIYPKTTNFDALHFELVAKLWLLSVSLKFKMAAGSHFEFRPYRPYVPDGATSPPIFFISDDPKTQIQCQKLLHFHCIRVSTKGTGLYVD